MRKLLPLLFLIPAVAYSLILIDDVMSRDDQKKTGISTLNHNQRQALEQWLNDHVVMKTAENAPIKESSLALNLNQGKKLQLSDGSVYEINPADTVITQSWLTPFPILIYQSGDPAYPIKLVNKNDGTAVKARKIQAHQ